MERLKKLDNLYKLIIGTVATILTTFILDDLTQRLGDKGYATLMTILAVTVIILVMNFVLESLFENSVLLRKMLFGDDFIEGYWYDITFNQKTKKVRHSVLFSIFYEGGQIKVSGLGYDPQGNRVGTFKSTESSYSNRVLFYQYESHTNYNQGFIEIGVSQLCFDKPANSYSGFYLDYSDKMRFNVNGDRVPASIMDEHNGFKTNEDKKAFILKNIEEFEQNAEMQS